MVVLLSFGFHYDLVCANFSENRVLLYLKNKSGFLPFLTFMSYVLSLFCNTAQAFGALFQEKPFISAPLAQHS